MHRLASLLAVVASLAFLGCTPEVSSDSPSDPVVIFDGCRLEPGTVCPNVNLSGLAFNSIDLSGADLRGAKLKNTRFDFVSFEGANLEGADLSDGTFNNSNMAGANLSGAVLLETALSACNLSFADFSGASITKSRFNRSNFSAATFEGATLKNVNLDQNNFDSAMLENVDLKTSIGRKNNFSNANMRNIQASLHTFDLQTLLRGTNLSDTMLTRVVLKNFDLSGTDFSGANLTRADFSGANLSGANLSGADLTNTTLLDARLTGANLTEASLGGTALRAAADTEGINLTRVALPYRNLRDLDLSRANLTGANLGGANLDPERLDGAIWSNTTCPDGTNSDDNDGTCCGLIEGPLFGGDTDRCGPTNALGSTVFMCPERLGGIGGYDWRAPATLLDRLRLADSQDYLSYSDFSTLMTTLYAPFGDIYDLYLEKTWNLGEHLSTTQKTALIWHQPAPQTRSAIEIHVMALESGSATQWTAARDNFEDGSITPRHCLVGRTEDLGSTTFDTGFVGQVPLALPFGDATLDLMLQGADMSGIALSQNDGIRLMQGTIRGWIALDDIARSLNDHLRSETCACLGLDRDPIGSLQGCPETPPDPNACADAAPFCGALLAQCGEIDHALYETDYLRVHPNGPEGHIWGTFHISGEPVTVEGPN